MLSFKKLSNPFVLVLFIFIFGFILRFYNLSSIPKGLYPDETAIGYNAYSILESGKDEFGKSYPIYFRSFDDYKLPLYIYSTSLAIKLFGATDFSVRVTSALFGSLSIIFIFFLTYVISKKKYLASTTALFLALNPWELFFSRAGYEVNVATSLMLLGTLLFVLAVKNKKVTIFLLLSALAFLLSVYTYNVTRLISPIIFISLLVFYRKSFKNSYKKLIPALLLFGAGMLPFLVTFYTLQKESGFSSQQDALLVGNAVRAQFIETRSYFSTLPQVLQKLIFNYWAILFFWYIRNLVSFFSTSFYFIIGSSHPNQNIHLMAMFYYFEFPLMILGAYQGLKKKAAFLAPFAIWLVVIFFFVSIIESVPNGTRTFPVVIPLTALSSYGFYLLIKMILNTKNKILKISYVGFIVIFMSYSYLFFLLSYFLRYPIENAKDWRSEDKRTVEFIKGIEGNYKHIVFDDSAQFFYTSLLYYKKFDPTEYQSTAKYRYNGLVTTLVSAGKYSFENIDWNKQAPVSGWLYIVGKDNVPSNFGLNILSEINYPTRPIGIYYDRKIGQLSVTDNAYVIFEKK